MPISTRRFTEIRLMISDLLQRRAWQELYQNCATNDIEHAKSVANIFSLFDSKEVWKFANFVAKLPPETRREKRDSTLVVCLTLGRIGQSDLRKAIGILRALLADDHMLRLPVEASLSNLWVLDRKATEKELFDSWIVGSEDNEDLQQISVLSSRYLLSQEPKLLEHFLSRILHLDGSRYRPAITQAKSLIEEYGLSRKIGFPKEETGDSNKEKEKAIRKSRTRLRKSKRRKQRESGH